MTPNLKSKIYCPTVSTETKDIQSIILVRQEEATNNHSYEATFVIFASKSTETINLL